MGRLSLSSLILGFAVMANALSAQGLATQSNAEALPDVPLPPALNRVLRDYEHAWRDGDASALAALFAEDGFVLQSDAPPIRGRSAIERAYTGKGGAPLRLRALAYAGGTTHGYIIGAYRYGSQPGDVGKFTLTLRRKPGERWLIFSDMDNANALHRRNPDPPATASSPGTRD